MERPTRIFLVDLTYTQQGLQSEIMPAAIGGVATYAEQELGDAIAIRIFKRPEKLISALEEEVPNIIGFSNYAWNARVAYAFAQTIKRLWPDIIVVMGGPNYPLERARQIALLRERTAVDFFICHEGEVAFAALVKKLIDVNYDLEQVGVLPSVNYIRRSTGEAVLSPREARIRDLTRVPSPYLAGLMDEFFEDGFMPIIQTKRGCPFTCTFCVEGESYYTKIAKTKSNKSADELHYIGKKIEPLVKSGKRADLFIADSNFGMFGDDIETCKVIRDCQDLYGWPEYISVATGKNQKDRVLEAARIVRGAIRMSGSVQSLDDQVLVNIKRKNVSVEALVEAAKEGNEIGANTYSEVILGLPGDSRDSFERTIARLLELGFNRLTVYTLMLLPGSELDTIEMREEFAFQTKYRVIPRCFGYWLLKDERISVGEIEEVVVGSNTMSFDDYLHCRWLNFLISLFYNNGLFTPAWDLLKSMGVPLIGAVQYLSRQPFTGRLKEIAESFKAETVTELWDSREALAEFLSDPANVDRYIAGDIGNNIVYRHQSMALVTAIEEMAQTITTMMRQVLTDRIGQLNDVQLAFLDELTRYNAARALKLFHSREDPIRMTVRFDHENVIKNKMFTNLCRNPSKDHKDVVFTLNDEQQRHIGRLMNTYGDTIPGLTRLMARTNLRRLLRQPHTAH